MAGGEHRQGEDRRRGGGEDIPLHHFRPGNGGRDRRPAGAAQARRPLRPPQGAAQLCRCKRAGRGRVRGRPRRAAARCGAGRRRTAQDGAGRSRTEQGAAWQRAYICPRIRAALRLAAAAPHPRSRAAVSDAVSDARPSRRGAPRPAPPAAGGRRPSAVGDGRTGCAPPSAARCTPRAARRGGPSWRRPGCRNGPAYATRGRRHGRRSRAPRARQVRCAPAPPHTVAPSSGVDGRAGRPCRNADADADGSAARVRECASALAFVRGAVRASGRGAGHRRTRQKKAVLLTHMRECRTGALALFWGAPSRVRDLRPRPRPAGARRREARQPMPISSSSSSGSRDALLSSMSGTSRPSPLQLMHVVSPFPLQSGQSATVI